MAFSALAIEALCNSLGKRVVPDWQDFESSPPVTKLRLLTEHLDIEYRKDDEPWSTARWLVKFRNLVAHAKPEFVVEEVLLTQEEQDKRLFDTPKSKLEKQITLNNSKRSLQAAEQIKDILVSKIPVDEALGLDFDGWSGSTELHNDD